MEPQATPNQQPNPSQESLRSAEAKTAPVAPEIAPAAPAASSAPSAPTAPVAIPDPTQAAASPTPQATAQAAPTVATPAVAGDVDVIEREWVDKANDIIKQTKDDPHKQEEAVENLQVDYLKKRYGHEVKKPDGQ